MRLVALAAAFLLAWPAGAQQQGEPAAAKVGPKSIGGVVSSPAGPEAGVWVIAETTELPTRFARIVVTDDQGRYLIPDLPPAGYSVWARGYGLVDSPKMRARPGQRLDVAAQVQVIAVLMHCVGVVVGHRQHAARPVVLEASAKQALATGQQCAGNRIACVSEVALSLELERQRSGAVDPLPSNRRQARHRPASSSP